MTRDWTKYRHVLLLVVGGLVALTIVVAASTSAASFSAYNSAWDGASGLRGVADSTNASVVAETDVDRAYEDSNAVVLVLSPDSAYDDAEARAVERFLAAGGTLVVADDFGSHSNDLLADVGARARIHGGLLRDERNYHRSPNLTRADGVGNGSLVGEDRTLVLNHGSVVRPNEATVLAESSEFSYLDRNRNYRLDDDETMQAYPVVTRETVGNGSVIVVSDPSLFVNAMLERGDNRAFAERLLEERQTAVLDYSHAESLPPLVSLSLWLRATPAAQLIVGVLGVGTVGVAVRRRDVFDRLRSPDADEPSNLDPDAVADYLEANYPEWDPAKVRLVMRGIINGHAEEYEDD